MSFQPNQSKLLRYTNTASTYVWPRQYFVPNLVFRLKILVERFESIQLHFLRHFPAKVFHRPTCSATLPTLTVFSRVNGYEAASCMQLVASVVSRSLSTFTSYYLRLDFFGGEGWTNCFRAEFKMRTISRISSDGYTSQVTGVCFCDIMHARFFSPGRPH